MSALAERSELVPGREQSYLWIVTGLIVILNLGLLLFILLGVVPRLRKRDAFSEQLEAARAQLAVAEQYQVQAPQAIQEQLEQAETVLESGVNAFLSDSQAHSALNNLYAYSRAAGAEIINLQTEPILATDVSTPRVFRLEASSSIDALLDFVSRIEEVKLPGFAVDDVAVFEEDDSHKLTMAISLHTSPYARDEAISPFVASGQQSASPASLNALQEAWMEDDWEAAIRLLEQMLVIAPNSADAKEGLYRAHMNFGYALLFMRRVAEATTQFEAALDVKPNGQEALAELQQLAENPSLASSEEERLVQEWALTSAAGDWRTAIRVLRQIQLLRPDFEGLQEKLQEAYVSYGNQLAALGQTGLAQEQYTQALRHQGSASQAPDSAIALTSTVTTVQDTAAFAPTPTLATTQDTAAFAPTPTLATLQVTSAFTPIPTPTSTQAPSPTPNVTPIPTLTPTQTPAPTNTPAATATPTPTPTSSSIATATPTSTPTGSPVSSTTPTTQPAVTVHIVRPSDTLYSISKMYNTTVAALMAANGLTDTLISVGQSLLIVPPSAVTVTPPASPIVYTVQPGDTLYSLAQRYGTTVHAITSANGLRSSNIYAGQYLFIPVP